MVLGGSGHCSWTELHDNSWRTAIPCLSIQTARTGDGGELITTRLTRKQRKELPEDDRIR